MLKVAFVRKPLARLLSAYRFETMVQHKHKELSLEKYLRRHSRGLLSNYQTRHLSPQDEEDWQDFQGWGARPELIDLSRTDLFVGLVERYDESIVSLEHVLEEQGMTFDLAYPLAMNTTRLESEAEHLAETLHPKFLGEATELDERLYRRVAAQLDTRISAIADFDDRLENFRKRCAQLSESPVRIKNKLPQKWTRLPIAAC